MLSKRLFLLVAAPSTNGKVFAYWRLRHRRQRGMAAERAGGPAMPLITETPHEHLRRLAGGTLPELNGI